MNASHIVPVRGMTELPSNLFETMSRHDRSTIAIECFRKLAAEPDTALLQIDLICHVPNHGLPIRVKDQIAGITEKLDPVSARLETIQEIGLGCPMFGGTAFDTYIPF